MQMTSTFKPSDDFPPADLEGQDGAGPDALGQASPAIKGQREIMMELFLEGCYSQNNIGRAFVLHTAFLDRWGPHDPRTIRMGFLYEKSLDAEKTGNKVDIPKQPQSVCFPHYMEMEGSYKSRELPGVIYDLVMGSIPTLHANEGCRRVLRDNMLVKFHVDHPIPYDLQDVIGNEMKTFNVRLARIPQLKGSPEREAMLEQNEVCYRENIIGDWSPTKDVPTPPLELLKRAAFVYVHGYDEVEKRLWKKSIEEYADCGGACSFEEAFMSMRAPCMQRVWGVFGDLLCSIKASLQGPALISWPAWLSIAGPSCAALEPSATFSIGDVASAGAAEVFED